MVKFILNQDQKTKILAEYRLTEHYSVLEESKVISKIEQRVQDKHPLCDASDEQVMNIAYYILDKEARGIKEVSTKTIKEELIIQGMDPKEADKFIGYHRTGSPTARREEEQCWYADEINESLQRWNSKYKISGLEQVVEKGAAEEKEPIRETLLTKKELEGYLSEIGGYAEEYVRKEVIKHPDIFQKGDKYILEPIKDLVIRGLVKEKSREEEIDFSKKRKIPKLTKQTLADQIAQPHSEEPEEIQVEPVSEKIIKDIEEDMESYKISGVIEKIYKLAQKKAGKGPINDIAIQEAVIEYGMQTGQIQSTSPVKPEETLTEKMREVKMVETSPVGRSNPRGDPSKYNFIRAINIKGGTYIGLAAAFIATLALIFNLDIDYSKLAKELKKDKAISTLVDETVEDKLKPYKPKDEQKVTDDAQDKRLVDIEKNYKTLLENTSKTNTYVENLYEKLKQDLITELKEQIKQPRPSIDPKDLEQLQQIQASYRLIREELNNVWNAQFAAGKKIAELKRKLEKKPDKEKPKIDLEQRLNQLTQEVAELTIKYETVKEVERGFKEYLEKERRTKTTIEPPKEKPPEEEPKPKEVKEEKPKKSMSKADKYRKMLRDRKKK